MTQWPSVVRSFGANPPWHQRHASTQILSCRCFITKLDVSGHVTTAERGQLERIAQQYTPLELFPPIYESFCDVSNTEGSLGLLVDSLKTNTENEHKLLSADQLRQNKQVGQMSSLSHNLVLRNSPHWPDEVAGIQGRFDDAFTALYLATRAWRVFAV